MSNKLANINKLPLFYSPVFKMEKLFEHVFDDVFGLSFGLSNDINYHSNVVEVAVPGYTDKDISIHLENGYLTVKGERKTEHSTSTINKSFSIPNDCDPEKVEAKLENGMLTLTFQPLVIQEKKQIPINCKSE
jgi:HSP20 family molecular chaperone IbpA